MQALCVVDLKNEPQTVRKYSWRGFNTILVENSAKLIVEWIPLRKLSDWLLILRGNFPKIVRQISM
jgi:hypothetical protein